MRYAVLEKDCYVGTGEFLPAPMAGILVYAAVPDVVGSLGGLAELAEPDDNPIRHMFRR